jgi:hypothetical protein
VQAFRQGPGQFQKQAQLPVILSKSAAKALIEIQGVLHVASSKPGTFACRKAPKRARISETR